MSDSVLKKAVITGALMGAGMLLNMHIEKKQREKTLKRNKKERKKWMKCAEKMRQEMEDAFSSAAAASGDCSRNPPSI